MILYHTHQSPLGGCDRQLAMDRLLIAPAAAGQSSHLPLATVTPTGPLDTWRPTRPTAANPQVWQRQGRSHRNQVDSIQCSVGSRGRWTILQSDSHFHSTNYRYPWPRLRYNAGHESHGAHQVGRR